MVYDAADGYVLLFGGAGQGSGNGSDKSDTWEFKSGAWTQLSPSVSPQVRYGASMAYDEADGYVVLFGGGSDMNIPTCFGVCDDTWEFKAGSWTQLSPSSSPSGRSYASMAYDAADGYVLLFGGAYTFDDTWTFKAGSWTELSPASAPSPRYAAPLAYDAADGYTLLSGGYGAPSDTWEFKAGSWTQLSPSISPSPRAFSSMAYDAADGYVLLFGGSCACSDTWQFKAGTWTQLSPSNSPPQDSGGSMSYDAVDGYFVYFPTAYSYGITWEFKAGTWTTQLASSNSPLQRETASMVYDAADGYVLLFGGYDGMALNDTWEFKAGTWTRLSPLSSPSPRYYASMTYDAADGYVLLFGGANGTILGDSWEFKAGAWTRLSPPIFPRARYAASMVYDDADGYALLFGGENGGVTSLLGDTWQFKAGSWTQLSPSNSPQIRAFGLMTYDAADDYALLFGGNYYSCNSLTCASASLDDTWGFKAGTWTQLSPPSPPSARSYASVAYDALDGYVLLFGGTPVGLGVPTTFLGETWEFKAGTWAQLSPSLSPSPRLFPSTVFDGADGYVLLFGGYQDGGFLGDSWKFVPSSLVLTTTTLSCDSPVVTGAPTTCTATVSNTFTGSTVPSGTVSFSLLAGFGSFASSSCTLSTSGSSASCSTDYTSHNAPDSGITETLSASYSGDSSHGTSSGGFNLSVLPRSTTSSLSCLPSSVMATQATVCTVTVTDVSPGTSAAFEGALAGHGVAFYTNESGTFSSSYPVQNVCVLVGTDPTASCSANYTPSDVGTGTHEILTGYSDHSHAASYSTST